MTRISKKGDGRKNRILLVEDHPVFRDGLANVLNAEPDLTVCGEAGDAKQGLKAVIAHKPDLVVVDLGLPDKSGLELIKDIRAKKLPTKLLVVSMFDEGIYAQRVLRAGGDGYIMKQEDPDEIVHAIRDVLAGHIYVSEEVFGQHEAAAPVVDHPGALDQLTDSELEVLESLGQGKTILEVSAKTRLPEKDVTANCNRIRRKLKLRNTNALIRYAVCWVEGSRQ
jgi:DNA-binding NarL/FixJ family response regulator